jgi:hypothetical protein
MDTDTLEYYLDTKHVAAVGDGELDAQGLLSLSSGSIGNKTSNFNVHV